MSSSYYQPSMDLAKELPLFSRKRHEEVFLSFRGKDTRASFASHLYASLQNAGITVFRDDDSLQEGDRISKSLHGEIEESRISIVVFSKHYGDSRWCLQELVQIMKCHRTIGQVVLPVFFDVDPSEVRHQTGEFGNGFHNCLNKIKGEKDPYIIDDLMYGLVNSENERWRFMHDWESAIREIVEERWRAALSEAAGLAGFVVLNYRNEIEAIKDIVKKVTHLFDKTDLFIANNPVGVESRVQDMIQLLVQDSEQSNDVLVLGMWGMGGIGKTTIAKAIYNKIGYNFEGRCFLANIREVWEQNVRQVDLQEQILFDINKEMTTKIQNIELGKNILKERLCRKKVLVVLDDVNTFDQLNALCGSRKWFGSGSRIIITTRDMRILSRNPVNRVFKMRHMDENESIELFSWHAFKQATPTEDFAEISRNVVEYSGGLPLALEVLGSYLFKRRVTEWQCVLDKLKIIPNYQVQKKLKISYDALNDDTEKEIFLDIACFFIGMDRNDVILILDGCRLFGEIGISILVERSLVTVDDKNRLGMHDLLRDMGREIIREKSPEELEERCRLWYHEDVLDVLSEQTGTKAIKGLTLKLPRANEKCFSTKTFKNMKRLRLLQLAGVKLDGDFGYLSRNLRWLSWNGFSSTHIPTNFCRENLVSIELENSNVKFVWKDGQMMEKLKILNLSHSHCLTHTPDFLNMPNLEKLILKDCPMLTEIDKLEEDIEQMESLTTLVANSTAITRVPFSVVRSKSIGFISLCGYEGFSHDVFPSVIWSWMSPTNNLKSRFQTSAAMSSLVSVDVPSSSSHELSSFLNQLPRLRSLLVDCNSEVQLSIDAKMILDALFATNSKELESTATATTSHLTTSTLVQHCNEVHFQGSKHFFKSLLIKMGMNCQVTNILNELILQNMNLNESGGCFLPVDSYPNWLTFNSEGSSVTFQVPHVEGRNLKTMMCIVYTSAPDNITSDGLKNVLVKNYTKATIQLYKREALISFEDEEGQRVVSSMEPGDKVEVAVVFENSFTVKKTTVYLVYDEPISEKLELNHVPDFNVIACSDDENEHTAKRFSTENKATDDFNQNRKKKNRVG
ncbi:hypothetical protein TSUD_285480 [Trifolium subterraneum]|uniref:TIR domain-containing protein n=1 Tax=Trifolium subterraneum TaxID=3900 RepID=A0A2Z6NJ41_TRISU|nr:hypothetical protein TSUD_285480 [Trifolium subterraneum]